MCGYSSVITELAILELLIKVQMHGLSPEREREREGGEGEGRERDGEREGKRKRGGERGGERERERERRGREGGDGRPNWSRLLGENLRRRVRNSLSHLGGETSTTSGEI